MPSYEIHEYIPAQRKFLCFGNIYILLGKADGLVRIDPYSQFILKDF